MRSDAASALPPAAGQSGSGQEGISSSAGPGQAAPAFALRVDGGAAINNLLLQIQVGVHCLCAGTCHECGPPAVPVLLPPVMCWQLIAPLSDQPQVSADCCLQLIPLLWVPAGDDVP